MKLFLSSKAISEDQKPYFLSLVGKEIEKISFALIENAKDPYPEESRGFMYETRKKLMDLGMNVELVDLLEYREKPNELYDKLKTFDVIWCGGGNTFYLRWLMRVTGLDVVIHKLVENGVVYGGGSAGAIVAGPTLEKFDLVDDPDKSPEIINEGLGLSNLVIIPHWGYEEFQTQLEEIKNYYMNTDYTTITLQMMKP